MFSFIFNISFALVFLIFYWLIFPTRAGNTSRVVFMDRIILAFRLGFSRLLMAIYPFHDLTRREIARCDEVGAKDVLRQKLMSAENAVRSFVVPHSVLYLSGFAATESPAVWSHALKEVANKSRGGNVVSQLTIISQTGSSLRGVGSDSIDNVITDTPRGTVKRLVAGHLETCVGTLRMLAGEQARERSDKSLSVELYNIPLGVISRLVGLQAADDNSVSSSPVADALRRENGVESVSNSLHPRTLDTTVGVGSYLEKTHGKLSGENCCKLDLVTPRRHQRDENEVTSIRYGLPPVTVAMVHARFADQHGNVHFEESTLVGDAIAAARAAKRNGGKVLVSVQEIRTLADDESVASLNNNNNASAFVLPASSVDAISCVSSMLLHDFSGLARHCRMSNRNRNNNNADDCESMDREQILELWERSALGYAYATTFHPRWRDSSRDAPAIMHAHDEVVRLARLLTRWKKLPVVRIIVGVSLPELVAMRLAESGLVFLGSDVTDKQLVTSPFALRDEDAVEQLLNRERELADQHNSSETVVNKKKNDNSGSAAAAAAAASEPPCIQFVIESGVVGGLPAPGFLFGGAFHPHKILQGPSFWNGFAQGNSGSDKEKQSSSSSKFVHMCILGAGEVDVTGAVNVSRGGDRLRDVIGCGGFPDIVDGTAYAIVIVVSVCSGGTRFKRPHGASIVQRVREATFSPLPALKRNVSVRYCTEFGVFHADLCDGGKSARLVAPPGLEVLVQEKCKVNLIFDGRVES